MAENNLNSLNPAKFAELVKNREIAISQAGDSIPKADLAANDLADMLHPKRQYMRVSEISEQKDCKTYKLVPDKDRGTQACAYFAAGQYVSVFADVDGKRFSRPYSLVSLPCESAKGYYLITVKALKGGLVSGHILNSWKVGTAVELSDPTGNFTFEPLRDAKNVVGIAGGSGITPFMSMARSVAEGDEDMSLTLIYASRTEDDILFKAELDRLCKDSNKIRVVYVLSDEEKAGFEQGFVTAELIAEYAPEEEYSVFICGPKQMTAFVDKELQKLNLEPKFIRHEVHGEVFGADIEEEYPTEAEKTVKLTVHSKGESIVISASTSTTLLRALEQNGIAPPSRCRSGECGFCHSKLVKGRVYVPKGFDKRRKADEKNGFIHPCCSFPLSDIEIEIYPER